MELYPILESRDAASPNIWYVLTPHGDPVEGGVGTKCCSRGSKVFVCGGANPAGAFGSVYEVCLDRFKLRKLNSEVTPRYEHAMVLHNNNLIVFGGATMQGNRNDIEMIQVDKDQNVKVYSCGTNSPCPRTIHNVASSDNHLYVWGGGAEGAEPVQCTDTFLLDTHDMRWARLKTTGTPPCLRHGHVLCCVENTLYIHGGMAGSQFYDDMFSLDLDSCVWSKFEDSSIQPSPRAAHISASHAGKIYMFGGLFEDRALDDLWTFDCKTQHWSEIKTTPPSPHPRLDHCMCIVNMPYCKDNNGSSEKMKIALNKENEHITDITDMLLEPNQDTPQDDPETPVDEADGEQTMLYMFGGMDAQGNIFNDMYLLLLDDSKD